jgi:sugar lactone lactonase YvrE
MPEELRERLVDAATAANRSLNREIVHRLEQSFEEPRGERNMGKGTGRRTLAVLAAVVVVLAAVAAGLARTHRAHVNTVAFKELQFEAQGTDNPGDESNEGMTAQQQFAEARTAPSGIVDPGAYSSAVGQLNGLKPVGGTWTNITARKYDADSPYYRDFYSNSSGGAGLVTGRITGLAADAAGNIYAAGADGGVWRRLAGANAHWEPIADQLPSLSSGDLELGPDGALWYATGEANTGGTSYVGAGVYRLANPTTGQLTPANRVGGDELESTTIGKIRFSADGTTAWAATLRGVWSMPLGAGAPARQHWTLAFAPNPKNLPAALQQFTASGSQMASAMFGSSTSSETNAPYKNIVNDVAVDPKNAKHVIAAVAWRSGDAYNGFYETTDGGLTWAKVNPTGAIPANDIGYVTFAFSKDGGKLYAINQSPRLLNKLTGVVNSYLDGIYVSNNGSVSGPWSKIADTTKLANSGSALKQAVSGKGYGPGIQAWYNQFLAVDPTNSNHVYAGLEEVFETKNGGSNWNTVGPYWNFLFSCWAPDSLYPPDAATANRCPLTTHSDQHSIAIGGTGKDAFVVVGNDGGVYERPLNGTVNGNGNATDWVSLNDGTIDALQYYAVGIGKINPAAHTIASSAVDNGVTVDETKLDQVGATSGVLVSGGLQDNGGSLLNPAKGNMVSNFGGDGGDVLVDPNDGCNIVQEYVNLSMTLTQTCGSPDPATRPNAFLDLNQTTQFKIGPRDITARFIAPFVANKQNVKEWLAGGNSLWVQTNGFAIRSRDAWTKAYTLPGAAFPTYTALALNGDTAVGGWCGPCNNNGFTRGITIGTRDASQPSGWKFTEAALTGLPNRFVGGVAVANDGTIYAAVNGFSRRFTEGEGVGIGHVFQYDPKSASWNDISANFPDVPASSIQALSDGTLVVGTDLGVVIRQPGQTTWNRLGTNLPLTVAMDVELGPDGKIYAATHGRGIWSIAKP